MGNTKAMKTSWRDAPLPRGNAADRSPESVAMVLRNARLLQGYGLREVERALNIRLGHLEALEERRFRDLPPLVYAKGFVAAYASFLNLDKDDLVTRFCAEAQDSEAPLMASPSLNAAYNTSVPDHHDRRTPSIVAIIAGLMIAALAYGVWQSSMPSVRDQVLAVPPLAATTPAPKATPAAPIVAAAPVVVPAPAVTSPIVSAPVTAAPVADVPATTAAVMPTFAQPAAAPAAPVAVAPPYQGQGVVVIRALTETWVQLKNAAGQRVGNQVLKAGQSYMIRPKTATVMVTGSLNNISILLDGQPISVPNAADRSRVELKLNANDLLNGTALLD